MSDEINEALRASEIRYRRLFETAKDGILILDAETGAIVDANPFLIELLGYSRAVILGKYVWDLGSFKDVIANQDAFEELQRKGYVRYEDLPLETVDSRRIDVEFVSNVYRENGHTVIQCNIRDITARKRAEANQRLLVDALRLLNRPNDLTSLIEELVQLIKRATGLDAVGLRLCQGEDFPYYVQIGFPDAFVKKENSLCAKDQEGNVLRDAVGQAVLECLCGIVLRGCADPDLPGFTKSGSFWTNHSSELLQLKPEEDPRTNPRNRCIHAGYESLVLIPLRSGEEIIGLLQLNAVRSNQFTLESIRFFEGLALIIGVALKRGQAEGILRNSELKYRRLHESMTDAFVSVDMAGRILESNSAFQDMLGYPDSELRQLTYADLTPEKWHAFEARIVEDQILPRGHSEVYEKEYRRKDGTVFPIELRTFLIRDAAGRPIEMWAIVRDITERRRAEEALKESEEKYRKLIETTGTGYVIVDDRGLVVDANMEYLRLTGRQQMSAILGHSVLEWTAPHDFERNESAIKKCIERGFARNLEIDYLTPAGQVSPIEINATVIGAAGEAQILTLCRDIAERKQIERQMRLLADTITASLNEIYIFDADTLRFRFINQGALRNLGYTEAQVSELTPLDLKPEFTLESFQKLVAPLRCRERSLQVFETVHRRADGSKYPVEVHLQLMENAAPPVFLAVIQDITERKKLEAHYLRAQRMNSIGSLAGGIAHDLNNILSPILMAAPLLRKTVGDPEGREMLNAVETCARRGTDIIGQLLTFARGKPGAQVPLPVRQLMQDMDGFIRETFPRNIQVSIDVPGDLWVVLGDATQFHQALMNLCVNARDAMPEGGDLMLEAKNLTLDETSTATAPDAKPGNYVCISVTDTGTGIQPEFLDRIFEPFFTTKEFGGGTGLGLATVSGIVRGHDGFVWVDSRIGRGTTFQLCFPASPDMKTEGTPEQVTPPPRAHGELVLIVDDEAAICYLIRRTLESQGYRTVVAAEGSEAMVLFARHREEVKAVITDLMMPGMDGPSLIRALRRLEPQLPILALTGLGERAAVIELESLGLPVLLKPFVGDKLLEALHKTIALAVDRIEP